MQAQATPVRRGYPRRPVERRELLRHPASVAACVSLVALVAWLRAHQDVPWVLWWSDEQQWGQLARRLAAGDGFTTGLLYPMELHRGVGPDTPSLLRPPLWPLLLGSVFRLTGPVAWAAHATVLTLFVAGAALAALLARRLAGAAAGIVAGLAVATSPHLLIYALGATPTAAVALLTTLAFWLVSRGSGGLREGRAGAVAVGAVCGAAYLTRYNAAVLLPVALALVAWRRPLPASRSPLQALAWRPAAWCLAGFGLVAAPWWVRNALVAGDPFVSYASVYLRMPVVWSHDAANLWRMLDPLGQPAPSPLEKLRAGLPGLLAQWPLASANLAACAGVALGCLRRDRLCWGFLTLAGLTTVALALTIVSARYFAPLVPLLLALGAAAWMRFGGPLRAPALALLLAAPLLPAVPAPYPDLKLLAASFQVLRESTRSGGYSPVAAETADARLRACLAGRPLVISERASHTAWVTDAVVIYRPVKADDFWRILDEYPVEWVEIERARQDFATPAFHARFEPRPDCGVGWYRRRQAEDSS